MKSLLIAAGLLFLLVSCKTSEPITVDQVSKSTKLTEKKTFKMISQDDASKDILQLNRLFEKKLIENGFSEVEENPELLVQSVIASINYEKEMLGYSGSVGLTDKTPYSPPYSESGKYGKIIFLIQDGQTHEVLWMGTGSGVLTSKEVLNTIAIKSALDQLIAGLK